MDRRSLPREEIAEKFYRHQVSGIEPADLGKGVDRLFPALLPHVTAAEHDATGGRVRVPRHPPFARFDGLIDFVVMQVIIGKT